MVGRTTRSRAAATQHPPVKAEDTQQLSSPPSTPAPTRRGKRKSTAEAKVSDEADVETEPTRSTRKRARVVKQQPEEDSHLPHNLGTVALPPTPDIDIDEKPVKKESPKNRTRVKKEELDIPIDEAKPDLKTPVKKESTPANTATKKTTTKSPAKSKSTPAKKKTSEKKFDWRTDVYPTWPHPTREEAYEVYNILTKEHGNHDPKGELPKPSLIVAGCGNVKSVLDGLIRTLLSANTTNTNAGRALQGLVEKFGVETEGPGKGSVNYNNVRIADVADIKAAIHHGGMADKKSKFIKDMLQIVHEENQARAAKLKDPENDPAGAGVEDEEAKQAEINLAEKNVPTLQYVYFLDDEAAFEELKRFEGIGVKTSACVLLFSLRRPAFAVDTHIFRLCKWLNWVPPQSWVDEQNAIAAEAHRAAASPAKKGDKAATPKKGRFKGMPRVDRDPVFYSLDAKLPDELKHALHNLLITHGKKCPRCRAITGEGYEGWNKGCVLDHLLRRDGARKGTGATPKKGKAGKKSVLDDDDEEAAVEDDEEEEADECEEDSNDD